VRTKYGQVNAMLTVRGQAWVAPAGSEEGGTPRAFGGEEWGRGAGGKDEKYRMQHKSVTKNPSPTILTQSSHPTTLPRFALLIASLVASQAGTLRSP
jgi:hypothetical protein